MSFVCVLSPVECTAPALPRSSACATCMLTERCDLDGSDDKIEACDIGGPDDEVEACGFCGSDDDVAVCDFGGLDVEVSCVCDLRVV